MERARRPANALAPESAHRINLSWLVRLRWGAVLGQLVTVAVVQRGLDIGLPLAPLLGLIAFEAATNVGASWWLRRGGRVGEGTLALTMGLDVVILTALLALTGGPSNPFNFLYLVHIALAAVVLRAGWTWALVSLSLLCSGALFYADRWFGQASDHVHHMRLHLEGMWIAFGVAAAFIVYFVTRVRRAVAEREEDLERQRAAADRNERLAALATLAAGAAHELATPLSTIAVVVRELERRISGADGTADLRLIRAQVDRCRAILDQMAADAGQATGEPIAPTRVREVVTMALRDLPAISVKLELPDRPVQVRAPARAMAQALRGIVKNAHEARPGEPVTIALQADAHEVTIAVVDQGPGMPPDVLARAGEPFFTTKAAGQGMGLGLFLARTLVERLGGRLSLRSQPGVGTTVGLSLPAQPTWTPGDDP